MTFLFGVRCELGGWFNSKWSSQHFWSPLLFLPMAPSSDESSFRATLASAKRVVILAGAGLSAGSGMSLLLIIPRHFSKFRHQEFLLTAVRMACGLRT